MFYSHICRLTQPLVSRKLALWLWLLMWVSLSEAQSHLPIGDWQLHVPYRRGRAVAYAGDKVYLAAQQGLFYYDKEFNAVKAVTKADGLQEQQVSAIQYDEGTGTLVIAYTNSRIDLLHDAILSPLNDIYRKAIPGDKAINQIYTYNKLAYLSCSFGVVVLDLQKREVRESYANLGAGGATLNVLATAIRGDSIFLATAAGVWAAPTAGANLQDFRSWKDVSNGMPGQVNSLAVFGEQLYAGTAGQGLFVRQGSTWQAVTSGASMDVRALSASASYLTITSAAGVTLLTKEERFMNLQPPQLENAQEAISGADDNVWVADARNGLLRIRIADQATAAFAPDGPYSSSGFRVYAAQGNVYVLSGGYTNAYQPQGSHNGFYKYTDGTWQSFNSYLYPNTADVVPAVDLVDAVYNPVTDKVYFASYGSGLLEWGGLQHNRLYTSSNSPLLGTAAQPADVRITAVATDAAGAVWVLNRNQQAEQPGLFALQPTGNWQSFILPAGSGGTNLDQLLIDDNGYKWLSYARQSTSGSGLVVFDEKQNRVRQLSVGEGSGGLPGGQVYSMAKDLNGDVWVGTNNGVGVYYTPAYVFEEPVYDARTPVIDRRPLLAGQTVRSIAVDGANRKWMGTDNGLWLFSPDGDQLLRHFTTANSPLPSDKVLSVAVEHRSGEVFIVTDAGIASYRAEATVTEGKPTCAVVFPNPVRHEYTGVVAISGLPNNADVRITDISGTLVYKTRATGGTLAWNARDYNGKRVKAGVYLVMSASTDGSQACISKVAVLE
ncbi:two-component regulator propeller domain-containing protein [Pontibacter chitinilyticus]|uniref:type IX secretion system anionic LPS delivery protein PorZ n=1 Tax=Pontibacter chitinilyticus TaxID=2674989 RepID=UPI00321AAE74